MYQVPGCSWMEDMRVLMDYVMGESCIKNTCDVNQKNNTTLFTLTINIFPLI